MDELHYKVFREVGAVPISTLAGSKSCTFAISEPDDADVPEGEWYCENSDCVVRECVIRCKSYGEPLPKMHCPACAKLLKFHHWLGHETLVPVR